MRKKALFSLLAIILASMSVFSIFSCEDPPCNLPAPRNLNVSVVMPDTALLQWDSVAGAQGYRIVVTDTTNADTFGIFNTTLPQLTLTGLTPGHYYNAEVRAKCDPETPSLNAANRLWRQEGIIIEEIVMMPGSTGMDSCTCGSETTWPNQSYTSSQKITLPGFGFTGNPPPHSRVIYQIRISVGTYERTIKLAFDHACNAIKLYVGDCGNSEISIVNKTTSLEFVSNSSSFLTLTPEYNLANEGKLGLTFHNSGAFHYRMCNGTWGGYCN